MWYYDSQSVRYYFFCVYILLDLTYASINQICNALTNKTHGNETEKKENSIIFEMMLLIFYKFLFKLCY